MATLKQKKFQSGFTLIELLIVIAILAILATVVFIGIDPMSRFQDTRNSKRSGDLGNILNALKMYQVDHNGAMPATFRTAEDGGDKTVGVAYMIGTHTGDDTCAQACNRLNVNGNPIVTTAVNCVDLTELVTITNRKGGYLPVVPVDPTAHAPMGTAAITGYYAIINDNKSVTIGACDAEKGTNTEIPDLSVMR